MYKVFGDMLSGNCYKIKLLMQFLKIEHDWFWRRISISTLMMIKDDCPHSTIALELTESGT